ncbi:MAG: PPK2 family polyphosphate kinase [Acidobacteriota bacterium]
MAKTDFQRYLVPFDGSFSLDDVDNIPPEGEGSRKKNKKELKKVQRRLDELQALFYATDNHSMLLVFQAMDAAGKDGTIRAVLRGLDPAGTQVFSFKKPSAMELDHDFLWRSARCLPERGRIGVFNRSYYEEVLVVRVHPEYLDYQKLPERPPTLDETWESRYRSIRDHEQHLADNGTVILKFFLNVSHAEQRRRFLDRLDEKDKNWKFSMSDVEERRHWPAYMDAYQAALNATSREHAPWYAIPADDKPYMRRVVAEAIVDRLEKLGLKPPELSEKERSRLDEARQELMSED